MDSLKQSLSTQLDRAIELYWQLVSAANESDGEAPSVNSLLQLATMYCLAAMTAIERSTGPDSLYSHEARQYIRLPDSSFDLLNPVFAYMLRLSRLFAVLKVVREAITEGYLDTAQELIHAEVFSDFLEMAEHLHEEGYKDPAAVVAGTVLEQHLRKLCLKHNLTIEATYTAGKTYPKKAETLNTELAGQQVYGKNEQKQVTAWLGIRNSAAHGKYEEYTHAQVDLLIQGIRGFLAHYPA